MVNMFEAPQLKSSVQIAPGDAIDGTMQHNYRRPPSEKLSECGECKLEINSCSSKKNESHMGGGQRAAPHYLWGWMKVTLCA